MKALRELRSVLLLICLVGFPIGAFWLGRLFLDAANRGKDLRSQGRFAQMEVALLEYHKEHGAFPPTRYQPVAGGPVHSWRVLVLPHTSPTFIKRYPKYDFSQEWNNTNNLQALGGMAPGFFRTDGDGETAQLLAIGDGDEWPTKEALRARLITGGKDRFLLVEYRGSKIHWMEPKY